MLDIMGKMSLKRISVYVVLERVEKVNVGTSETARLGK